MTFDKCVTLKINGYLTHLIALHDCLNLNIFLILCRIFVIKVQYLYEVYITAVNVISKRERERERKRESKQIVYVLTSMCSSRMSGITTMC